MNIKTFVNSPYLIVATGTDIGKSFLVENICKILTKKNIPISAIKPIASGFLDDDSNSDSTRILRALNQEISLENINKITPWRFKEPISPHLAAKRNNQKINFLEVVDFCKKNILEAKNLKKTLLIETAGGLMTPINDDKTFLDLAFELEIPVLLLSANYLGSISHSLCAVEVLKNRQIFIEKIIINDDLFKPHATEISDVIKTIANFSNITTTSLNDFLNLINDQHN